MAVTTGFSHYVCDRCGREAYLSPSSAEASTWSQVQRVSVDKATSADPVTRYTMCNRCRDAYVTFDRSQDDAFTRFMADGRNDNDSKEST